MDISYPEHVIAFDSIFTTNHIQMLKILLPTLTPSLQKQLAVYIKLSELQYTITFLQRHPYAKLPFSDQNTDISAIFDALLPLCSSKEKEKMQNFRYMYRNLENMQEMLQILEMMKEISPELFTPNASPSAADENGTAQADGNSGTGNMSGILEMLSGLGGMEPNQMIELLQGMFAQ